MAVIFYRAGYKYQLAVAFYTLIPLRPPGNIETEWIALSRAGDLLIKKGYAWDGPSGPTIDTASAMRGSLIHDALYQLIRLGQLEERRRKEADQIYWDACVEDGMWRIRAWAHFKALRLFGGAAADPRAERPILRAP